MKTDSTDGRSVKKDIFEIDSLLVPRATQSGAVCGAMLKGKENAVAVEINCGMTEKTEYFTENLHLPAGSSAYLQARSMLMISIFG